MNSYIANDGDRVDVVAYKAYETLDNFNEVLNANPHLLEKELLHSGDVVWLPDYKPPDVSEVKTLWN